jgi:hypothetical protein
MLNMLQVVHVEAAGELPPETITLIERLIKEAADKLKALGDLETVTEKDMAIGQGIDYPDSPS